MSRARVWRNYAAGSEIDHFSDFAKTHLIQSEDRWEGQPLKLEVWQRRMLGEALAFDESGWPVWRSVVLICPRKNGKTAMLAALSLYRLLTSAGRPEILLAAPSDKVAGRLFDAAARFVRRSPELSRLLRVRDHAGEIAREDGMGVIYRLSSDPARLHGYNPTHVVVDELAQWGTPNLRRAYAALTSGGGARSAPQIFTITTAGEASQRHDSILGRLLDAGLDAEDVDREPGLTGRRRRATTAPISRPCGGATRLVAVPYPPQAPQPLNQAKNKAFRIRHKRLMWRIENRPKTRINPQMWRMWRIETCRTGGRSLRRRSRDASSTPPPLPPRSMATTGESSPTAFGTPAIG